MLNPLKADNLPLREDKDGCFIISPLALAPPPLTGRIHPLQRQNENNAHEGVESHKQIAH